MFEDIHFNTRSRRIADIETDAWALYPEPTLHARLISEADSSLPIAVSMKKTRLGRDSPAIVSELTGSFQGVYADPRHAIRYGDSIGIDDAVIAFSETPEGPLAEIQCRLV